MGLPTITINAVSVVYIVPVSSDSDIHTGDTKSATIPPAVGLCLARKLGDTEEITEVTFGWNQIDYSNNNNAGAEWK